MKKRYEWSGVSEETPDTLPDGVSVSPLYELENHKITNGFNVQEDTTQAYPSATPDRLEFYLDSVPESLDVEGVRRLQAVLGAFLELQKPRSPRTFTFKGSEPPADVTRLTGNSPFYDDLWRVGNGWAWAESREEATQIVGNKRNFGGSDWGNGHGWPWGSRGSGELQLTEAPE